MIIPLDKLMMYAQNKYVFTKASMKAVDRISNIKDFPEENLNWKVVPHILKVMLNGEVKFEYTAVEEPNQD
jgi:hypothetical protein